MTEYLAKLSKPERQVSLIDLSHDYEHCLIWNLMRL